MAYLIQNNVNSLNSSLRVWSLKLIFDTTIEKGLVAVLTDDFPLICWQLFYSKKLLLFTASMDKVQ